MVFAVPELLPGPEDDTGCFLFRPSLLFGALHDQKNYFRNQTGLCQLSVMIEFTMWIQGIKSIWKRIYRDHN